MSKESKELLNNKKDETQEQIENEIREEIFSIAVRLQEIDTIIERYEDALLEREEEILSVEEVEKLEEEYYELKQKKKQLSKSLKKTRWDMIPIWMGIYAVFQFIFSFFALQLQISYQFAFWLALKIYNVWDTGIWLFYVLFFLIPFFSVLLSLLILLKIKNRDKKKIFGIIFLIQGLETIVTIIIMIVSITR